jgi:hypothetical protein
MLDEICFINLHLDLNSGGQGIFVLYLPVHIPVFLWMRGGTYFTTYKI